jgi:hypothetical protein
MSLTITKNSADGTITIKLGDNVITVTIGEWSRLIAFAARSR